MKNTRLIAMLIVIMTLLSVSVSAVPFVPSIERKDGPEVIEYEPPNDLLLVVPLKEALESDTIHDDIKTNLLLAYDELERSDWHELIASFALRWHEFTEGSPLENAVVSDIFDARFLSELGMNIPEGVNVSFKIELQGITHEDTFMLIYKAKDSDLWEIIDYTIDENDVITIAAVSMSAFAVVLDNEALPKGDFDDGPQTGVNKYFTPAIIGIAVFAVIGTGSAVMLAKKRRA